MDFYANEFNEAIASTKPNPRADQVVKLLKEHGVKVYLATNPIFPRVGTMNRIRWAGIDAEDFEVITIITASRIRNIFRKLWRSLDLIQKNASW